MQSSRFAIVAAALAAAGTTVRWTNTDSVAHTSTADAGAFNFGHAGGRRALRFRLPGRGELSVPLRDSSGDGRHDSRAAARIRTVPLRRFDAIFVRRQHLSDRMRP